MTVRAITTAVVLLSLTAGAELSAQTFGQDFGTNFTYQKTGFDCAPPTPCSIWYNGDYWQESVVGSGLGSVSQLDLNLNLSNNLTDGASILFGVFLNAVQVGSFDMDETDPSGMFGYQFFFSAISGSDYDVRLQILSPTVPPNDGSVGLSLDGTSSLLLVGSPGTVTPEPVSMVLLGTGLVGLGAARRRRKLATAT